MTIITRFILRFAVLVAVTVAVLSSVGVNASRTPDAPAAETAAAAPEDSAETPVAR